MNKTTLFSLTHLSISFCAFYLVISGPSLSSLKVKTSLWLNRWVKGKTFLLKILLSILTLFIFLSKFLRKKCKGFKMDLWWFEDLENWYEDWIIKADTGISIFWGRIEGDIERSWLCLLLGEPDRKIEFWGLAGVEAKYGRQYGWMNE